MVGRGPRKILDIDAPNRRERKKPGPKPKAKPDPLLVDPAKYVPPPRKFPKIRYTNEQIIEVLQYLYYHRILDKKPDGTVGEKLPRYRGGTILQKMPELGVAPEGHRYRSPTYEEAADWFQIPKSTVATWWNTKLEMIGVRRETPPQAPMPDWLLNRAPVAAPLPPPVPGVAAGANANEQPVPNTHNGGATITTGPPGVTSPPPGTLTPAMALPATAPGPAEPGQAGPAPAAGQQAPYQSPYAAPPTAGVAALPSGMTGAGPVPEQAAPGSAAVEQEADSSAQDTPTPTPSEQLAGLANLQGEGSGFNEVSGSEQGEEEEEEEEVVL